jgi:hypothetical protein
VDVTGTYTLRTLGGNSLPTLGTGELVHAITIVLDDGGSCTFTGLFQPEQENPEGEVENFAFDSCSYSLDGTELTLNLADEEEEAFSVTTQILDGQFTLEILIQDDTNEDDEGVPGAAVFVKV